MKHQEHGFAGRSGNHRARGDMAGRMKAAKGIGLVEEWTDWFSKAM